jgi:hypothetical protein
MEKVVIGLTVKVLLHHISMFSELLLSIAKMTSPGRIRAFSSGPTRFAEITTPVDHPLRAIG